MRRRGEDVVEEAISVGWQGWDGVVRREEAVRNVEVSSCPLIYILMRNWRERTMGYVPLEYIN